MKKDDSDDLLTNLILIFSNLMFDNKQVFLFQTLIGFWSLSSHWSELFLNRLMSLLLSLPSYLDLESPWGILPIARPISSILLFFVTAQPLFGWISVEKLFFGPPSPNPWFSPPNFSLCLPTNPNFISN